MVSRDLTNSSGTTDENYVNDGQDLALVLTNSGQVTERELNGPEAGQVFGSEEVTPASGGSTQSAGTLNWLLSNPQGTDADLAQYTSGGGTSILDHIVYNPFGQITYQSTPADQPRFTYAGQRLDSAAGLTYEGCGSSWYDAVAGMFGEPRRTRIQWQCQ